MLGTVDNRISTFSGKPSKALRRIIHEARSISLNCHRKFPDGPFAGGSILPSQIALARDAGFTPKIIATCLVEKSFKITSSSTANSNYQNTIEGRFVEADVQGKNG
jgi:hypothetical protein